MPYFTIASDKFSFFYFCFKTFFQLSLHCTPIFVKKTQKERLFCKSSQEKRGKIRGKREDKRKIIPLEAKKFFSRDKKDFTSGQKRFSPEEYFSFQSWKLKFQSLELKFQTLELIFQSWKRKILLEGKRFSPRSKNKNL